jgi:hypothetical protein
MNNFDKNLQPNHDLKVLRVDKANNFINFNYFATVAQAENFRRQFRKIIPKELIKITCGKSPIDKSKGRIDVFTTTELFNTVLYLLDIALSIYVYPHTLYTFDCSNLSLLDKTPIEDKIRLDFNKPVSFSGEPYQLGVSSQNYKPNTGYFAPPVYLLGVDVQNSTLYADKILDTVPILSIVQKLSFALKKLEYRVESKNSAYNLILRTTPEQMTLSMVLLYYALDISMTNYRVLLMKTNQKPLEAFEIGQVLDNSLVAC